MITNRPNSIYPVPLIFAGLLSRLSLTRWATVFVSMLSFCQLSQAADPAAVVQYRKEIQPILKEFCYDCHGDGESKGKIAFDELTSNDKLLNHDLWLAVMKNTRGGLMPPIKKAHPTPEQQQKLEQWIKFSAFGIDPKNLDPGRVTIRRLNRVEYRNTIKDLMGIDYNTESEFPPDDTGFGFDNIGDVLTISPMLLEKYLGSAQQVVADSVPVVSKVMPEKVYNGKGFAGVVNAGRRNGNGGGGTQRDPSTLLSFYEAMTISNVFKIDIANDYIVAFDLGVKGPFDYDASKCKITLTLDGRELSAMEYGWYANKSFPQEFPMKLEPGEHQVTIRLEPTVKAEKQVGGLDFKVVALSVKGPMDQKLWTKPANYDRFFSRAEPPTSPSERKKYAREILTSFANKAFRRPADPKSVERFVTLAEQVYTVPGKSFEAGVSQAMVAVLASPWFLFRSEDSVKHSASSRWDLVDEYSLASRLSYFLWSSMPDKELTELAAKGELRKNLRAQVKRMLADSKAEALAKNFTGQWLESRDVDALATDAVAVFAREVPLPPPVPRTNQVQFNGPPMLQTNMIAMLLTNLNGKLMTNMVATVVTNRRGNGGNVNFGRRGPPPRVKLDLLTKQAMRNETESYFSHIVTEDRSVLELIESDYTFLNAELAKAYDLTNLNVTGTEIRKVTLPAGSARGGILTHGSVLAVTSNPDRTSPVKRGLFVLDNILGTPVPPAPPNVPALELAEKDFKDHKPTLREALQLHRDSPLCSSCHSRMDPIGLGMENFNALGVWRDKERDQKIDAAGKLITGESFTSVQELKHILATNHKSEFYRCLTTKLMTYALGRGTEYYDAETIDQIVQKMDSDNGRFGAMLMGIIESAPFQKQRNRSNDISTEQPQPALKPTAAKVALK